ncbi:MAG: hypothetical protein JXR37_02480 [Kiritimatiellae bacterium]|nr:hypothetical protein [Kiritimatiellia bacterium]
MNFLIDSARNVKEARAGIRVTKTGNRIEGNNVTMNEIGIEVTGTNNLVVRNNASANTTNYWIGADNSVGGISDVTQVTFTNTNPWVNFEF